jgi:hypothetical protein
MSLIILFSGWFSAYLARINSFYAKKQGNKKFIWFNDFQWYLTYLIAFSEV